MSTEMGLLPTFFSDLFHTLWFGKRILCDYKMKFKNTREILFVVTHVITAVTFTLQRVGLIKKGKQKGVIYFQTWVYQMLHFFKGIDNTVSFSINISHLFVFDLCNNVSLLYWQILKLDFQTWVNLNTNFIFISACICSCRVNKLTNKIYRNRKVMNSVMFALLLLIVTVRWVLSCIWILEYCSIYVI